MQYEVKKIDTWSVVRIVFIISLVAGFFLSLLYVLFLSVLGSFISNWGGTELGESLRPFGGVAAMFMVIFLTVMIAVIYSIMAAVITSLYNFLSKWAGGILVDIESTSPRALPPLPPQPPVTEEPVL